ncbi:cytochrome P450 [Pholiota conissans]|uniref:Cytochrome P450 n=1 Tax=Pholiota conissans TaxID=109636 RepID=A0A9P5ZAS2_9AGAR|nr:cytochrome P450 [Pholiota conissans]
MGITSLDIALLFLSGVLVKKALSRPSAAPLPPGPRGWPLLGNLLDMPTSREWLTFADWGRKWGDIVSISMFGHCMVVVNSMQMAIDMLEKEGAIYSDRPVMEMGGELVGWKTTLVLVPYGARFRNYRKLFHQTIGTQSSMAKFYPGGELETRRFLKRVLENPDDLNAHVRKTAGSIILRISHGYKVKESDDPFVNMADIATEQFALSTAPGGFLVNLVPVLKYIPSWFPGAGFKKTAAEWAVSLAKMANDPHQFVKEQMAHGVAEDSFTSRLLSEPGLTEEQEFDIKWSAASLYSGGADTTVASVNAFFLAMALHPEVMRKAQEEIDSVIGNERLPCFADRPNLPYVNAVQLEVFRWHSVAPTGVPHRVMEDNIFNGFFIPKGALVIPNIWGMTHDPNVYPNPTAFQPERFLGSKPAPDPKLMTFGFGRRICPGRVLADASVFMSIAMSLAVFNITVSDKDAAPVHEQMTGTISHPKPFKCSITARSSKAAELILSDRDD